MRLENFRTAGAQLVLSFSVLIMSTGIAFGDDAVLGDIRKAWEHRIGEFRNARLEFITMRADKVTPQMLAHDDEAAVVAPSHREDIPDLLEYSVIIKMSIEGSRMRHALSGKRRAGGVVLRESNYVSAYDGDVSAFLGDPDETRSFPSGHIYRTPYCEAVRLLDNFPVRWTFAPFCPEVSEFQLSDLSVDTATPILNDHECVVLATKAKNTPNAYEYWVDPVQKWSIVRFRILRNGRTELQLDCKYESKDGEYIPTQWTAVRLDATGEPYTTARSEVTRFEPNVDWPAGEFQIEFPVGTVVSDARPNKDIGRTGTLDYIVLANGKKRIITWNEREVPYERLLATPSGEGDDKSKKRAWGWGDNLFVGLNIVLIASVAVYCFKRASWCKGRS